MEKVLEVTIPELDDQRNRVNMMLEMISVATGNTPVVAPLQIQCLYDGLEGCVHFKDDNLIQQVVSIAFDSYTQPISYKSSTTKQTIQFKRKPKLK